VNDADRLAELRAFLEAISPFGSGDRVLSESMVDKIMDRVAAIVAAQPAPDALREYGPCSTRLENQPTSSVRPWRYGHAASIEGAHWDIYAGDDIEGWLVGMVTTEADAALIVGAVNDQSAPDALRAAAQEHGLCSCDVFGGPRPLGNGQEYHYVGCDYDPALRAALEQQS
jgi:hypothetical protein